VVSRTIIICYHSGSLQISRDDMVACDNGGCTLEWFHFKCVNISEKPAGKWYCPNCRGGRSNLMSPEVKKRNMEIRKLKQKLSSPKDNRMEYLGQLDEVGGV